MSVEIQAGISVVTLIGFAITLVKLGVISGRFQAKIEAQEDRVKTLEAAHQAMPTQFVPRLEIERRLDNMERMMARIMDYFDKERQGA